MNAPMHGRVAASSAILIAESVVRIAVTAFVSFWLARQLGPQGFGMLNGAVAVTAVLWVCAGLGLDVPAVLRLARTADAGLPTRLLATVLWLRTLAALPAIGAAAWIAWLLHADDAQALAVSLVVALSIVGYAPSVLDVWFRSRTQALPPATARLVATLMSAALKLWLLAAGAELVWLAVAVVVEACLHSAVLALWLARTPDRPHGRWHWDGRLARDLLRQAAPLLVAGAVVMIYMKSDVVLLSALTDHTQTGLYALAQKMSEVLYIVPVAIVDSLYPLLAARRSHSATAAPAGDQLLFDLAAASAWVVAAAGVAVSAGIVRWVFGDAYAPTAGLFAVHAWTCVMVALDTARQRWLVAAGLERRAPWLAGTGACVAIALNLALIPWLGALGAAWAALGASAVCALLASFAFADLRAVGRMQCRALWPWARLWQQGRAWQQQRRMQRASVVLP
jgi:O-antigen/teichoic acid export membrane protein